MRPDCDNLHDELAELAAGDADAIARHADHLASCDDCRDARHDAERLAARLPGAGADYALPPDLLERVLAAVDGEAIAAPDLAGSTVPMPAAGEDRAPDAAIDRTAAVTVADRPRGGGDRPATTEAAPAAAGDAVRLAPAPATLPSAPPPRRPRRWAIAAAATAALAAGVAGVIALRGDEPAPPAAAGPIGRLATVERAAGDTAAGVELRGPTGWQPLRAGDALPDGAVVRTDAHTRASLALGDGTRLVLDHRTELGFEPDRPRALRLAGGRVVADVAHDPLRPASFATPLGPVEVLGTRLAITATEDLTAVQVVRGRAAITGSGGRREEIRTGEEGLIEPTGVSVSAAPGLHRDVEWSELGRARPDDAATAGLGQLRAYKPGEQRDRDWNLALAHHDVKIRISGPVARTEITETFRNDSDQTLEGVYQFPLPADAQIDGLALDVPGGFEQGAFLDKTRAGKIWRGVIDRATPVPIARPSEDIIWVRGGWRDPALLDWKRGGRFELRIFPIPPKGARTIKLSYTQVATPRGPWRQYVYPLPHARDGSTVADRFTVDVEVRGAAPGLVRAAGYELARDPARRGVEGMTLAQAGFVPRGDLVIDYRGTDGDAELRAWTAPGGAAAAPDEKLAAKRGVGIDPAVVAAQRAEATDLRPTAVLALRPRLPRWTESRPRDYAIVVDASQSMVGERAARAAQLAGAIAGELDRRDRFRVLACDSECRGLGDLRAPSAAAAAEAAAWLAAQPAGGASDLVAAIRAGATELPPAADRERWILYIGDGFATTGFRRVADVERALAGTLGGARVATIGIGGDADATLLAAAARAGGGSHLAWVPGQSVGSAALAAIESTQGSALRGATVELPAGLEAVAPPELPTLRAGEETLIAARITGEVAGDVIVRGTVGGQPFEQRYPLRLAVATGAGNGFVPRLWARLAIDQLERAGLATDRARIVALSQGYGVMSRETSLLVLESAAMFEAFGVDRTASAAAKWTGEDAIEETVATGRIAHRHGKSAGVPYPTGLMPSASEEDLAQPVAGHGRGAGTAPSWPYPPTPTRGPTTLGGEVGGGGGSVGFLMRRWFRVPAIAAFTGVPAAATKAISDAEAALAAAPDSRERHRALVQALAVAGELPRALEIAARWLERDQLDPAALAARADLLGRAGQRELALRTLAGLVDLDPDRAALHERLAGAYDRTGRAAQSCAHRVARAALATAPAEVTAASAAAVRCLRTLGRAGDAELILRPLASDTARAAVEKAATAAAVPAPPAGELVIAARWDGGEDLDVSLVSDDGTRISWMGGRGDASAADATSTEREQLAVKTLRRGSYLVEVSRATASTRPVRGTLELTVLGRRQSLPFELTGARMTAGTIAVTMVARWVVGE